MFSTGYPSKRMFEAAPVMTVLGQS